MIAIEIDSHEIGEVRQDPKSGHYSFHAIRNYKPGDVICSFKAKQINDIPSYLTVQVANDKHISLWPECLQYINHSCEPNARFDTDTMELIAIQAIHDGEEFSYFYPSTEWEMVQPFVCLCGTPSCLNLIQGAKYLSIDVLSRYQLSSYIRQQIHSAIPE